MTTKAKATIDDLNLACPSVSVALLSEAVSYRFTGAQWTERLGINFATRSTILKLVIKSLSSGSLHVTEQS